MFIDARLGTDLLLKLHGSRPEPPVGLLERILATTGPATELPASSSQQNTLLGLPTLVPAAIPGASSGYASEVAYTTGKVLPFRQRMVNAFRFSNVRHALMQPRLAMTAAMAFFSIALTLNLTGVRITNLRAGDFTPSSLKRTFYDTNARVVRSVNNLRVVYELESRVHDLQRDNEDTGANPASSPAQNTPSSDSQHNDQKQQEQKDQQKRPNPRQRSGSSRSLGLDHSRDFSASLSRPGSSPEPGRDPRKVFVIFTPTVFNSIEQGGQA
jgi:hypothetical protein